MGEPSALCLESEVRLSGAEASSTVGTNVEQINLPLPQCLTSLVQGC